jgi:hypothetical protein
VIEGVAYAFEAAAISVDIERDCRQQALVFDDSQAKMYLPRVS